jgi:hypothetical protein
MDKLKYIINKYKIKVGNQYIVDIPKIDREDLANLFNELGVRVGVEVGVDKGEYSESLCKANPNCKIYGVDPYSRIAYEPNIVPNDAGFYATQEGFESNYDMAMSRLSKYPNYVMMRGYSLDVLKQFDDNSLDFVYIDANHDMPNFINDIHEWSKKVKMGGIVAGHDYAIFSYRKFNHVKRALEAYARSYRMIPLFIVGRFECIEGEKRDKFRSWIWIKDKHHG